MNLKVDDISKLKAGDRVENDIGQKGSVIDADVMRDGGSFRIDVSFDAGIKVTFWHHYGAHTAN